jgi:hypothetical protein
MNIEKTHSKLKIFLLYTWIIILLSQVLKSNFSYIYFPIFFSVFFIIAIVIYHEGFFFKGIDIFTTQIWVFYFLIIYIGAITFLFGSLSDFLKAFPRMIIMPLTLIVFMNLISLRDHFNKIIDLLIFFSIIAAISLIYQVYNGPLYFLVESHTRGGLNRYASTFGSLTIYGAVVGIITLLVIKKNFNFILKFFIITLFLTAAFTTLAKAAVINILIIVIFSLFFIKIKYKGYLFLLIISGLTSIYFLFPELGVYIIKSIESLGFSVSGEIDTTSNSSFVYQFLKRFLYSVDYLSQFSMVNIFFGFGLIGGQGVFGLPYSFTGTTHNQFMDLYLIGGVFLFLNIVILILCLMLELYKMKKKDTLAETFFFCNIIAIINMFFFNGFIYQPVTSIVFWLSIVYVLKFRNQIYEKSI